MATRKNIATIPCDWCAGRVPATAANCPDCGAAAPKNEIEVPGLTSVREDLLAIDARVGAHLERLVRKPLVALLVR